MGYGYGSRSLFRPWYVTPVLMPVSPGMAPQPAPSSITGRVNGEFMFFVANQNHGFAINANAAVEGDIFGVNLSGQNIQVKADDGSDATDSLTQLNAHFTVAVLSGELGRLRLEAGGDVIFAPSIITAGLSFGASGIIGIYGPMAFEGSFYATVYPFTQLDGRAALVFGSGPLGLKVGWRTQLLDDRGLADGVPHRDIFMGPYAALGLAF
ncbi:MAG: hypothetical protein U0228_01215 [Myxococcaceae bacterium]